jgi:hypothetical protein
MMASCWNEAEDAARTAFSTFFAALFFPVLTKPLPQLNFVLGGGGGAGGGGGGGLVGLGQKPRMAPPVATSSGTPLTFEIASVPGAGAASKGSKQARPKSQPVAPLGGIWDTDAEEAGSAVGKRSRGAAVDYKAMDAGPALDRKSTPVAPSIAAPSPSVSKKPKKVAPKVINGPGVQPAMPVAAQPRVKKEPAAPSTRKVTRLAPLPREVYAEGPPFINKDFRYPEDLMPVRPVVPPFDPSKVDGRVEELKTQIAEAERELNSLNELLAEREQDRVSIAKHFKAKNVKARRMQLEIQKRGAPGSRLDDLSPEPMRASSSSANKKRPPKRQGGDQDYGYEDEYMDDEEMPTQRKLARSSAGGGGGGSGGTAARKSKPVSKTAHLAPFLQKAVRLIDDLSQKPESFAFREPVDAIALGVPTYYEVVKNPMDLKTMREKAMESKYADIEAVANDFELIFSNCVCFNSFDSALTNDCKVLQKTWLSRLDKIRKQLSGATGGGGDGDVRRSRSAARGNKAAAKRIVVKDMTFEEKAQLMNYIGELPPEKLSNIVQIVGEVRALDGGEQEGQEVEVDFETLPTATLRKLQDFVFGYRRENGLEVTTLVVDEVQLAGEDGGVSAKAPATAAAAGPEAETPKAKKHKPKKTEGNVRASVPKSHEELKALAEKTKENTEAALQELKDELKRMAGKVVDKDHAQGDGAGMVAGANEYSLDPALLAQQFAAAADSDDSVSSDTVSSDEEGDAAAKNKLVKTENVHIIPVGEHGAADVVIENAAGWQLEEGGKAGSAAGAGSGATGGAAAEGDDGLWEEFANKDAQQMELAKARKEHEEQLKREREAKEDELRKAEKEKRARQEEEERRRREEKEREEREAQRIREEERLARKREREEVDEPRIDLAEQQRMMTDFERNK